MDWSLSEVTNDDRQSKNVHKRRCVVEPNIDDLSNGVTEPEGSGIPCELTSDVRGGESAFYVGQASRLREGWIHLAPAQVAIKGRISYEWATAVPGCERLGLVAFGGDSGALILSSDNKLLGLLWGRDNGLILLTPTQDVFADIKRRIKCH
ncbi:uncharacterized protein BDR25DRAFT_309344 [Lindgomyces ingoldianus]|uniref:Uncharacterized protein n=1 Tax=Lindgomyces ingoldianus TaxID=673940 RepID=A0ACB6REW0_9PLEO|nr:uncharacterized protein BDR25DRAFT_309344 [Lindgomyces ingoldianus]KAF2477027.1 hypothetical protein BDR25DRAFT_309344 [Lindgomyces ingoldianus]